MSRNARSNENGRFDEIFLERVNLTMDLTILTNFRHFRYFMHFWTYLTSSLLKNVFFRQKEPTEDENEGDKRQSND